MKTHILLRKVHYWGSLPVMLPLLVILTTGVLLQLKKNMTWVQPAELRGSGEPALSLPRIPEIVRSVPEAGVSGWEDVHRAELRPARGIVKVVANSRYEVQIDAASGAVLQVAYRRSDLIESIHDGSWFHPLVKVGVFLPVALVLLGLLLTGAYLFILPFAARRGGAKRRAARAAGAT